MPPITHPWEHFSVAGVAPAVDWFQKTLDGFGEAFRRLSWDQIGANAILSRAAAIRPWESFMGPFSFCVHSLALDIF